ncbi:class II glutamine amidotransferase [Comamonas testosteroni]|uniref:Glutamine amidotransferase class-II n=1 Tax=Comamonas testosteroni (strain DSM 14576 / KF-1) TaxID=399795 RepID=B7WS10_COMTK|nr:class II glutamine amidotransferase [Comamonas testosteroni]EED69064.1 glutamine amidotransferase class-II [Comamonas testosteroni KF-1]WQG67053.1 class II glutamine amidotransferase [Comamonas testosteroni]
MCRWLAYTGNPVSLETMLFHARHSLIDQSLHSRFGATTTNGDGFGLGWYQHPHDMPFRYRCIQPAWHEHNLRELSRAVSAPMFLAHVRAATHTPVQETNCHPFRHRRWMFMHNGMIEDFPRVRRDLLMAIDPQLFTSLEGSTDSETMFLLAMSFGLEHTPVPAIARMAGFVEATARRHGIAHPLSMTVCASDGEQLVAVRYASEGQSPRSLYHSTSFKHLHALYPDDPRIAAVGYDAYLIVSEPLVDLPQAWAQVPESTAIVVRGTQIDYLPFAPIQP